MTRVVGARIGRVDRPLTELVTLELRGASHPSLLVSVSAGASGVGIVPTRPRGRPIDSFGSLLRKHLEGSAIVGAETGAGGSRIIFVTTDEPLVLEAIVSREGRGYRLLRADGTIVGQSGAHLGELPDLPPVDDDTLSSLGPTLLAALDDRVWSLRTKALRSSLERMLEKAGRKCAAIASDLSRCSECDRLRHEASLLTAFATDDRPGRDAIDVVDWMTDPPMTRSIALDRRHGPRTAAKLRFDRARRYERGTQIAAERLAVATTQRLALETARNACELAIAEHNSDALDAIETSLGVSERVGSMAAAAGGARPTRPARMAYRVFTSARGVPIWVGKSARDNDELTVRIARPHHLFLHARGTAGSHVIVALGKGRVCDEATLADAATLAAHFSSARGEPSVEVLHAERRHVRKPRGSATGAVQVDREKVMFLRLEPARLARLLASETMPN